MAPPKQSTSANEKLNLALIGCGGRGVYLAEEFAKRDDCQIVALADVDNSKASAVERVAKLQNGLKPAFYQDFRTALDDPAIDAVIIATPDHWHALATVWACQAGKDVYVEKPPTHNCWEGQQMILASDKYNRIIQCGFQNRSAPYNFAAKKYIEDGRLGDIHLSRIFNQKQSSPDACPLVADSKPQASFDWDMWNGPAAERAYNKALHTCWNYQWQYSGGDIVNDASHQIDLARWLLGVELPKTVYSTGGRFATKTAAETPDTQLALYDFDNLLVSIEMTLFTPYMLKSDGELRDSDILPYWMQSSTRIEIYGTKAMMVVGRMGGGWQVFVRPKNRQPVVQDQMFGRFPDSEHQENFVHCVRSRQAPNSDIREAHLSALWIHYANISYRLGSQKLAIDSATQHLVNSEDAMNYFKRTYRKPWVLEPIS